MSDEARHITTAEQRTWLYAARERGGLCAACGRPLGDDEPVYVERFILNGKDLVPGPVGAECALPQSLRDAIGQDPERCIGCERPMYYRVSGQSRQRAVCSKRCANRVSNAKRRKTGV
jgi:hypothetical protein